MRLLPIDSQRMLTRSFDRWSPLHILDLGASLGHTVDRFVSEFPCSRIWALEPVPDNFARCTQRVGDWPSVSLHHLAAGPRNEDVTVHINALPATSSLLPVSTIGREYYGDWTAPAGVARVASVRLDDWAPSVGLERVDILKIDVQGLELDVLRGATRLLKNVRAIDCESPFVQEYVGGSTFLDVALFLRDHGFHLHQVHNLWACGREQQSTCMDGLWLREDELARLRTLSARALDVSPAGVLARVLDRCAQLGYARLGLLGCGNDLRLAHAALENAPVRIECLIDDRPSLHGQPLFGLSVLSQHQAAELDLDAVVITTSGGERSILLGDGPLARAGIPLIPVAHYHPELHGRHPLARRIARGVQVAPALHR